MKIIFFGTPIFAREILSHLTQKNNNIDVVAVVTQPDSKRAVSHVKEFCTKRLPNIPIYQPEDARDLSFIEELKNYEADLFIVVAYGQILSEKLIKLPKLDIINIHASLLPKYRGAAPIQRAILAGEKKTGVTIMEVEKRLDAGSIISKAEMIILPKMNFQDVHDHLLELSKKIIIEVIEKYKTGTIVKTKQDDSLATYAKKITKEDLVIDFNKNAEEIFNQVRAFSPKPGAYFNIIINEQRKKLKILECSVVQFKAKVKELIRDNNEKLVIGCKDFAISLHSVQLEGKKVMTIEELLRGVKAPLAIE